MNPVLLKPQSDIGAQVVVQGRVVGAMKRASIRPQGELMPAVMESFHGLSREADLVLVEGAGSASEVNLRAGDIANMGFAEAADVPVVLIGDIERGGVIASIVGTCAVLPPAERARSEGFLINKFRAIPACSMMVSRIIAEHTGLPSSRCRSVFHRCAGTCRRRTPWRSSSRSQCGGPGDPHRRADAVAYRQFRRFRSVARRTGRDADHGSAGGGTAGDADLIILPGTKATIPDLAFLREQGWDIDIDGSSAARRTCARHLRRLPDAGAEA